MIDFRKGLEAKVKVANYYLNTQLRDTGKVYSTDLYRVLTPMMRESGAYPRIDTRDYDTLDPTIDHVFIAIREAV